MNYQKYRPFPPIDLPNRKWPSNTIKKAPAWCSVDLRDGNQALEKPMTLDQKIRFFKFLVNMGFKEIEVGFPAASDTEYIFTRTLIEKNLIPDDVTIQVLTQSREHIIRKTFEALDGVKKAIVHLYNSTSTLQREVVFGKDKKEITALAVFGAKLIDDLADKYGKERFLFEYSPESFTGTELDYAAEICNAVIDVWKPTADRKTIINLPSTVEMATPNVYADQIEYMCNNLKYRENISVSLHAHNDRGCAVAATELGILAGADRVEGTLFGNGERTGNADIMNIALNMFTQGIDPELDFTDINKAISIYEESTEMPVHPRHPYAGSLVYTAFSGSHQDAIKKGMAKMKEHPDRWEVPYLPIDPVDVGRNYDPIIRINSQSGKGGVAYILENNYGLVVPRAIQQDFGKIVTKYSDENNKELEPEEIKELFFDTYVNISEPVKLIYFNELNSGTDTATISVDMEINGEAKKLSGSGAGIIEAFCNALNEVVTDHIYEIVNYSEHSLDYGNKSKAITYIQIYDDKQNPYFGAGVSSGVSKSSLRAVVSAVNKMLTSK
ncbi:MAG: 2-isopropylmalate synthase [Firmicutes bacterium]|nr:2-isopropylmalate synthase [Bacillota bacterium]